VRPCGPARPARGRGDPVGPSAPRGSYLHIERLIDAARKSGADAVHPGYGFLAENAAFAATCCDAELIFVEATPAAMALMGQQDRRSGSRRAGEGAGGARHDGAAAGR
jgi:acetyl/propionyl-CoA carboxylase alpha subunit